MKMKINIRSSDGDVMLTADGMALYDILKVDQIDDEELRKELQTGEFKTLEFESIPKFRWEGNKLHVSFKGDKCQDFKDDKCEKPPLGISPCWMYIGQRIENITEAIQRQFVSSRPDYELIKRWAAEICHHCDTVINDIGFEGKV